MTDSTSGVGGGDTKAWEEKIIKRQQESFGGDGCAHILITVIVSWIYTYVKTIKLNILNMYS